MSVILTGMEIPKSCGECGMSYREHYYSKDVPVMCPIVYSPLGLNIIEKHKNCPLKSLEGLIERLEQAKQYRGMTGKSVIDKCNVGLDRYFDLGLDKAIRIIKEYCGMEDK